MILRRISRDPGLGIGRCVGRVDGLPAGDDCHRRCRRRDLAVRDPGVTVLLRQRAGIWCRKPRLDAPETNSLGWRSASNHGPPLRRIGAGGADRPPEPFEVERAARAGRVLAEPSGFGIPSTRALLENGREDEKASAGDHRVWLSIRPRPSGRGWATCSDRSVNSLSIRSISYRSVVQSNKSRPGPLWGKPVAESELSLVAQLLTLPDQRFEQLDVGLPAKD